MWDWIDKQFAETDDLPTAGGRHSEREAGETEATTPTEELIQAALVRQALEDAAQWIDQTLYVNPIADAANELALDLDRFGDDAEAFPVVGVVVGGLIDTFAEGLSATASLNDGDLDGLTDGLERSLGTDARNSDSDDDGLSDGLETRHFESDPLSGDSDGDGLSDADEAAPHEYTKPYGQTDYKRTDDLITPLEPPVGKVRDVSPLMDRPAQADRPPLK